MYLSSFVLLTSRFSLMPIRLICKIFKNNNRWAQTENNRQDSCHRRRWVALIHYALGSFWHPWRARRERVSAAQRSKPLPSAPADPAQSVSSADQHRQNKPNRTLCGWWLRYKHLCDFWTRRESTDVKFHAALIWVEIKIWDTVREGTLHLRAPGRPAGTSSAFVIRGPNFLFCFWGFLTLSDRADIGGILWCGLLKPLRFVDGITHNGRAMRPVSAAAGQ